MRYSIAPRNRRYVKRYGFLSFAKYIGKNINSKYGQKVVNSCKLLQKEQFKKQQKQLEI